MLQLVRKMGISTSVWSDTRQDENAAAGIRGAGRLIVFHAAIAQVRFCIGTVIVRCEA